MIIRTVIQLSNATRRTTTTRIKAVVSWLPPVRIGGPCVGVVSVGLSELSEVFIGVPAV